MAEAMQDIDTQMSTNLETVANRLTPYHGMEIDESMPASDCRRHCMESGEEAMNSLSGSVTPHTGAGMVGFVVGVAAAEIATDLREHEQELDALKQSCEGNLNQIFLRYIPEVMGVILPVIKRFGFDESDQGCAQFLKDVEGSLSGDGNPNLAQDYRYIKQMLSTRQKS